jgi:phosphoenolpyruvate carboxylase
MAAVKEVEVFVMVDENGDYVATHIAERLTDLYEEDVNDDHGLGRRVIRITIKVPLPEIVDLKGEVPVEAEPTGLVVVTA